jgi:hypothetical protein
MNIRRRKLLYVFALAIILTAVGLIVRTHNNSVQFRFLSGHKPVFRSIESKNRRNIQRRGYSLPFEYSTLEEAIKSELTSMGYHLENSNDRLHEFAYSDKGKSIKVSILTERQCCVDKDNRCSSRKQPGWVAVVVKSSRPRFTFWRNLRYWRNKIRPRYRPSANALSCFQSRQYYRKGC